MSDFLFGRIGVEYFNFLQSQNFPLQIFHTFYSIRKFIFLNISQKISRECAGLKIMRYEIVVVLQMMSNICLCCAASL